MKKLIVLLSVSTLLLSSCNKYEDGPSFSLHTKVHRLVNSWVISSAFENGVDKTTDFNNTYTGYLVKIGKDNVYTLNYRFLNAIEYSEAGSWVWSADKSHVFFTKTGSATSSDWQILRLKEKELWGKYTDASTNPATVWELHFIPRS